MIASLARTTALRVTRPTARTLTTSARRSADPAATPTAAGSGKKLDSKEPGLNDHFGYSAKKFANDNSQLYLFFAGCVAVGVVAGSIFGGQNPEGKVHGGTQYRESGVEPGKSVVPGESGKANTFSKAKGTDVQA